MTTDYDSLTRALQQWKEFHRMHVARQRSSWQPALHLIQSASALDNDAKEHLAASLAQSSDALSPLGEPLLLNLGGHRWLASDREESYSDWLAWILQGITAAEILPLFGLDATALVDAIGTPKTIRRERVIAEGRTDIEVRFGNRGLLLIEVKVQLPGSGLSTQLDGYRRWVERQAGANKHMVLLAPDEPAEDITPFTFTSWRDLCPRLRNYANRVRNSNLLAAAAILLFCGAVEQNILEISARPERFRASASLDYLRTWRERT